MRAVIYARLSEDHERAASDRELRNQQPRSSRHRARGNLGSRDRGRHAEPANDTPPRVAEMIKSGAFDRKPGH